MARGLETADTRDGRRTRVDWRRGAAGRSTPYPKARKYNAERSPPRRSADRTVRRALVTKGSRVSSCRARSPSVTVIRSFVGQTSSCPSTRLTMGFRTDKFSDGFADKGTQNGRHRLRESVDYRSGFGASTRRPRQGRLRARVRGQSVGSESRPARVGGGAGLRARGRYPDGVEARSSRPLAAAPDRNGQRSGDARR